MILVTGGLGYIGSHTNKALNQLGKETIVVDNLSRGHVEFAKWGTFIEADLADTDKLNYIFKTYPIKSVMHFAAYAYVGESFLKPAEYYQNNVINTMNLLDVMIAHDVKSIVYSSSCATYGLPDDLPISESQEQRPINPYGRSKLMVERILADYDKAYGLKSVILRYFNAAGADPESEIGEWHEPETHLIPLTIEASLGCSKDVQIFGNDYPTKDGTCIRDYIHVTDLANAHVLGAAFLAERKLSDCFNLGNAKGFSVTEVIDAVQRLTGKHIKKSIMPRRQGDPPVLISDIKKAIEVLKWKPQYDSLDYILETAIKWRGNMGKSRC